MTGPNADPDTDSAAPATPALAVVVPVHNEAGNIAPLLDEIAAALDAHGAYEVICVDDGSTDATPQRLLDEGARRPYLRTLRHGARAGQSAAIATGVGAARAPLIATIDGDGQNDPADIPRLLAVLEEATGGAGTVVDRVLVAGHRALRRDRWLKRWASRIANSVRAALLGDDTPDTGCGLKVFSRRAFLDMPRFDHMHRFLPALMLRQGGRVISVSVGHRPREHGASKYGVMDRLWVGIVDLLGVMWLKRRGRVPVIEDPRTPGRKG